MTEEIVVKGLTKKYGDFKAVDNVSLSIEKGEIFGLLGPNGAGKSTTILMLMGLSEPSSGSIRVCGIDPVQNPIQVKKKVGYLPEGVGFYDEYTGLENLTYTARLNGIPKSEATDQAVKLLEKVGLGKELHKKVSKYSRGMRQRLGLADVLIKDPEVIILDEPTLGIDPSGVRDFLELIVELSRKNNITVLFSSHHLHQVQQVCDRVGLFVNGNLLAAGKIDELGKQLFSGNNFRIEGEVAPVANTVANGDNLENKLSNTLIALGKTIKTKVEGTQFSVEAEKDISAQLSRHIFNSGFDLVRLQKKVFGLDEIYHRYFEGVKPA